MPPTSERVQRVSACLPFHATVHTSAGERALSSDIATVSLGFSGKRRRVITPGGVATGSRLLVAGVYAYSFDSPSSLVVKARVLPSGATATSSTFQLMPRDRGCGAASGFA